MNFNVLAKPIGPICNLNCRYCFYLEKESLYPHLSEWSMNEKVLDTFIKQYIEANNTPIINFAWQGGEPTLLGVEYFKHIVALQQKYANGKRIQNAFQTNAVLLDDEWAKFFQQNNFLVGVSLDGPRELHDAYRVDKKNQPTFNRVMNGIQALKRNHVAFNTLTTVHQANEDFPREIYHFLKENGSTCMQFIPIVERNVMYTENNAVRLVPQDFHGKAQLTSWSVDPQKYGKFLCAIFDEWVQKDVGTYFVQLFDTTLETWAGLEPSLCIFQKQCGSAVVMEHNGDIYSCDHFVYPEYYLGNILETPLKTIINSQAQCKFGKTKELTLPRYCRQCDVLFACHGECPKHRFMTTPDGESGLNYLCPSYIKFFHHAAPYMQFMIRELAANRAPANVMQWAAMQK